MKMTYEEAYNELKAIAEEIEDEQVPVDVLADKVKRASKLIALCQTKLRATETEVTSMLKQMEDSGRDED